MSENKRRILLVDDEPPLLRLMQTYLQRLGYSIETREDATSAMALFHEKGQEFDGVVADLSLPDGNGADMAIQMAKEQPRLRVLLCSGYPFDLESLPEGERARFASLQKPFLPNMLTKSLEELFGRSV